MKTLTKFLIEAAVDREIIIDILPYTRNSIIIDYLQRIIDKEISNNKD